jgi:hypothetical protein
MRPVDLHFSYRLIQADHPKAHFHTLLLAAIADTTRDLIAGFNRRTKG